MSGNMNERDANCKGKYLSAKELLENRGIRSQAVDEWKKAERLLPKTGQKQFKPNGSWLQNSQIEKGLNKTKALIGVERVERSHQLATAEWLPVQKKAKVTKRSGQDWSCFGSENNGAIYLMPEETLFLVELNCLELYWDKVALSIQQAFEILVNSEDSTCSLEEYRVYSQLVRYGYRIQRFHYEHNLRSRGEEAQPLRKKVVISPENGNWAEETSDSSKILQMEGNCPSVNENLVDDLEVKLVEKGLTNGSEGKEMIQEEVQKTLDGILSNVESEDCQEVSGPKGDEQNAVEDQSKAWEKKKVEIISEETVVGSIKIIDSQKTSTNSVTKWPGSRIQRNVKLLPKRNDKPVSTSPEVLVINASKPSEKRREESKEDPSSPQRKKSKQEVIELSDDEIEEIPRPMTRMEMLSLLPNLGSQSVISDKIPRRYIPRSIKPQKSTYKYDRSRLLRLHETDQKLRENAKESKSDSSPDTCGRPGNSAVGNRNHSRHSVVPFYSGNQQSYLPMQQSMMSIQQNIMNSYPYRFPFSPQHQHQPQVPQWFASRSMFFQQNIFQNTTTNHFNMMAQNRLMSIQMAHFASIAMMGSCFTRTMQARNHQFGMNFQQNSYYSNQRFHRNSRSQSMVPNEDDNNRFRRNEKEGNPRLRDTSPFVPSKPSFQKIPNTSSWTELKKKWKEERTITIDDEEEGHGDEDLMDASNDIQVVEQPVKPLINPRNANSLSEVFERLQIIKSAPEKIVRRRKGDFVITYNVYSSSQHYKKANPGPPFCRIVIARQKDCPFIQPVELNRLQQEGNGAPIILAYVSNTSICYIQPGIINVPSLT